MSLASRCLKYYGFPLLLTFVTLANPESILPLPFHSINRLLKPATGGLIREKLVTLQQLHFQYAADVSSLSLVHPMADATSDPTSTTSSKESGKHNKTGPKPKTPAVLHPIHQKAIRYSTYMLSEEGIEQSATEFVQDAISRHLGYIQKHGVEFPPKMLAELTRLGLVK